MSNAEWKKYREKIQLDPNRPRALFPGTPEVIETEEALEAAMPRIRAAGELGFDTESRPTFQRGTQYGVALVQLATATEAWLIRTCKLGFHPLLVGIMQDPRIAKVGLALQEDLRRVRLHVPLIPAGFIDLQPLARAVGLQEQGVCGLSQRVLGLQVSKRAQLSNWEADTLQSKQILYAATDAWVALMIYRTPLFQEYLNGGGTPLRCAGDSE